MHSHEESYHLSLPPHPSHLPADVAAVSAKHMEAKFNLTLRPVFLTCVSAGFPKNFRGKWNGKTTITDS